MMLHVTCCIADNGEVLHSTGVDATQQVFRDAADSETTHEETGAILNVLPEKETS